MLKQSLSNAFSFIESESTGLADIALRLKIVINNKLIMKINRLFFKIIFPPFYFNF